MLRLDMQLSGNRYGLYTKLEFMNPSGSVKDRIAKYIIDQAEKKGLKPGTTIVEATSGNTGIALAMVAAAKGYKMLVVMPEHMTGERVNMMTAFGADICLTPKHEGLEGAMAKASRIADIHGYFLSNQFRNPDNVMAHYYTTGTEILRQVGDDIDAFVAGVGTGGTLMGVGKALRERNPNVKLVAVEPDESAALSGRKDIMDHEIAGIGDGFVPEIVDTKMLDRVVAVKSHDAIQMAKKLSREKALPVGVSSGANVLASIQILNEMGKEKKVVTLLPDRTERYFSTDLYAPSDRNVRRCSNSCECIFE